MSTAVLALPELARLPRPAALLLGMLRGLRRGRLDVEGPAGERLCFQGSEPGPHAHWRLHDWGVCEDVLQRGDVGLGEAWMDGRWESHDLPALLELAARNHDALQTAVYGRALALAGHRLRHLLRPNTRAGSRRNIEAHYDLGNDFYALWLDPTMTYSAALFGSDPGASLESAQEAKYERILERLDARAGQRILEIGCGWGGFAEYAARTRGCRVHGVTVSPSQLAFATDRIRSAGLDDRVRLELRDYRDLDGRYDHVVSIEMFEAVGRRFWPGYFRTLARRLAPGGRALVQSIVIRADRFARYARGTDFIQQYVFPGGMLPSVPAFVSGAAEAGLEVTDLFRFGSDYAETLAHWRARFHAQRERVAALGYDERFRRMWDFYLAYCEGGFRAGSIDVCHFELTGG